MPITPDNIVFRLTTKAGAAGDTTASTPGASLGKYVSTTAMGTGLLALFDNISGGENSSNTVDYRCVAVLNNHATLTLSSAKVYIADQAPSGANIAIAVDDIGPVDKGSTDPQASSIENELAAPTGISAFAAPGSVGTALDLGSIGPGQVRCFWVRRSATNSVTMTDSVTFGITGITPD